MKKKNGKSQRQNGGAKLLYGSRMEQVYWNTARIPAGLKEEIRTIGNGVIAEGIRILILEALKAREK